MKSKEYERLDLSSTLYKRYGEFTPILNEYFSRMKADMNLTDEEIDAKIELLLKNVKKIKFGIMPIIYKGYFRPDKQRIILNANLFNTNINYEQLFNIITHELDHACCYDIENRKFGLYRYDKKSVNSFNPKDVFLDELKTDIGSTRRVFNNNYIDSDKMIRHTYAYKNFSAFSTVLQNCLGISEEEFLKISNKGRTYFDKQMEKKFTNPKDYHRFIEKFALDASIMLNIKTEKVLITMDTIADFKRAFNDIKDLSYIGLNLRMEKEILDNPDINIDEYTKNMRYSTEENKRNFEYAEKAFAIDELMNEILDKLSEDGILDISNFYTSSNSSTEKKEIKSKAQCTLENKILYLEMLQENKESLGSSYQHALKHIISAKDTTILKEYAKEELNLEFKDNSEVEFSKDLDPTTVEKRKVNKNNLYVWDNREIIGKLMHYFNVNKEKKINQLNARVMLMLYPENKKSLGKSNEEKIKDSINELRIDMRKVVRTQAEVVDIDKKKEKEEKNIKIEKEI